MRGRVLASLKSTLLSSNEQSRGKGKTNGHASLIEKTPNKSYTRYTYYTDELERPVC